MNNNKKLYQHTLVRLYSFLMLHNNNTLAPSALACHFI